jgi:hypothetical protein
MEQALGTITCTGASNAVNRARAMRSIMVMLVVRSDALNGGGAAHPCAVTLAIRTTKVRSRLHAEAGKC